jgi:hypothetical protein
MTVLNMIRQVRINGWKGHEVRAALSSRLSTGAAAGSARYASIGLNDYQTGARLGECVSDQAGPEQENSCRRQCKKAVRDEVLVEHLTVSVLVRLGKNSEKTFL